MYLFAVQAAMTDQFTVEQQHRDLMPIALPGRALAIDIDHNDVDSCRRRQGGELAQHLLAQTAART